MQILEQLGSGEGLPIDAIRAATADRETAAPLLLEAIERCEPQSEIEENGLFIAFHLLGQWKEKSAYRPLAGFLRRPDIEFVLGDATTETSPRVMAAVFDGDPGPIYDIINDVDADEFVRSSMFDALVILALRGELDRAEVAEFLKSRFSELQPQDQSAVWEGWQGAVALLGLAELKPLVQSAFQRGFIDETMLSFEDFEDDLEQACAGRTLQSRRGRFEPFGDVVEELSDWAGFQKEERDEAAEDWRPDASPGMPAHNPFRNVGRNDPCPCGSGRKFKKCCLGKPAAELQAVASPDDPESDDFDDADEPIRAYDPFVDPDPSDWLATDEQRRLDLIKHYHRHDRLAGSRATTHAVMHAIVENQIAEGDQLPVRRTLLRLMAEGLDRHDAIHAIASVLAGHIHDLLNEKAAEAQQMSDHDINAPYFAELERLTAKGWLNSG
jgi:Protein of unknown function (DUF1186)/SEC-C motif